jgi:hypothetical protein
MWRQNEGIVMTIGLAIVIAAVLFLIDRNHVWPQVWRGVKQTLKVCVALLILGAIIWGGYFVWSAHKQRVEAAKAAADDAGWRTAFVTAATTCNTWEVTHPVSSPVDWDDNNPVYPPNGCEGPLENAYNTKVKTTLLSGEDKSAFNPHAPYDAKHRRPEPGEAIDCYDGYTLLPDEFAVFGGTIAACGSGKIRRPKSERANLPPAELQYVERIEVCQKQARADPNSTPAKFKACSDTK